MLNANDVGVLKRNTRVKVGDRYGLVFNAHEPQWIDHKTKAFRKELRGADIAFDDENSVFRYVHANEISIVVRNIWCCACNREVDSRLTDGGEI